jgi:hypothetical protein
MHGTSRSLGCRNSSLHASARPARRPQRQKKTKFWENRKTAERAVWNVNQQSFTWSTCPLADRCLLATLNVALLLRVMAYNEGGIFIPMHRQKGYAWWLGRNVDDILSQDAFNSMADERQPLLDAFRRLHQGHSWAKWDQRVQWQELAKQIGRNANLVFDEVRQTLYMQAAVTAVINKF